jgi:molybdopterin-containing oxidoreductase family iron-sulfur binding subunit
MEEQKSRVFYALEQLHALPSVNYLAKVRNTDRHVGVSDAHHETAAAEGATKEAKVPTGH